MLDFSTTRVDNWTQSRLGSRSRCVVIDSMVAERTLIFFKIKASYYGRCDRSVSGVLSVQARCYHSQFIVAAVCVLVVCVLVVDIEKEKELGLT